MSLARFMGGLLVVTVGALGYTMQQVALVRSGYAVDQYELRAAAARNERDHLQHQVLALKSPAQLETRLAALNVELAPTGREQIVRVAVPWTEASGGAAAPQRLAWWDLFRGSNQAEARGE